ncbi:MAG: cytochrome c [Gammaproteobacteria bacterium]|nr:cytochrome c [Rhodocyclaceae bacterium]MBU3909599.1 cytochrome c [Gammaproteobacteria bacterium]MBU3990221.1 cytochrome c [Gammaproteobacteria bacterium]MBU4003262.1 cytochrome c [Gammaproteobacteria bacterium]MBU4022311.1 cytochrome c [Gammaproteobacteria bacterium]
MNKKLKTLVAGITLTAMAGITFAQTVGKMEDQIRWRQSAYHTMAWSMTRIKANVDGQYNKDQVVEAANVIQAIANSKMGALYQSGSDKGKGWKETRLKSEFFGHSDLPQIAQNFGAAANEMAKVAAGGDAAAVKAQFGKLGEACKGCHDKFRKDE